jgi:hypothetical protein
MGKPVERLPYQGLGVRSAGIRKLSKRRETRKESPATHGSEKSNNPADS